MSESYTVDLDFGSGEDTTGLVSRDADQYAGQKGRTDRLAIIYKRVLIKKEADLTDAIKKDIEEGHKEIMERGGQKFLVSPWVMGSISHYAEGVGRFFCISKRKNGKVLQKELCCEKSEARSYFVAPVVHYFTDKNGVPKKPFTYEVKVWRFSEDKFKALKRKSTSDETRRLVKGDILVTCTEEQYQRMDLELQSKALWRMMKPEIEEKIYEEAQMLSEAMEKILGKSLSKEILKEKLGGKPAELTPEDLADPDAEDFKGLLES